MHSQESLITTCLREINEAYEQAGSEPIGDAFAIKALRTFAQAVVDSAKDLLVPYSVTRQDFFMVGVLSGLLANPAINAWTIADNSDHVCAICEDAWVIAKKATMAIDGTKGGDE